MSGSRGIKEVETLISTVKGADNPDVKYQILGYYRKNGLEATRKFLDQRPLDMPVEKYVNFEQDVMNKAKIAYANERNSLMAKTEIVEGVYVCPFCRSRRIIISIAQTRSADEGATIKATCADNLEHKFIVG